jgi:hypothetical protein
MHAGPATAALVFLLLAASTPLVAQGLASPGPLTTAHAKLDNLARCLSCHDAGRELSGRKCLACHTSLAAQVRADRGYHAVATRHGSALACRSCHSEHNGRPFRLVKWPDNAPRETFDHRQTGWLLEGAHAKQRCESCHKAGLVGDAARQDSSLSVQRTYLGLPTSCAGCHLDEHRGRVSRKCEDCHGVDQWKPARFDHDRTRFALTGLHKNLRCAQCHTERHEVARGPGGSLDTSFVDFHPTKTGWASGCVGCHPSPHREMGRVGACEKCHTVSGWFILADSVRRFDHTAIGFPLRGAHAAARCESCHLASARSALPDSVELVRVNFLRPLTKQRMVFSRCDACHIDVHQGQLRPRPVPHDCGACHTETRFTPARFTLAAHDSTRFKLTGAHRATPCAACHQPLAGEAASSGRIRFALADQSCMSCHRDPHGGQFASRRIPGARGLAVAEGAAVTTCGACHDTEAWRPAAFDHDSTRYPLRGAHRPLACAKCHQPAAAGLPVRFSGLPTTCEAAGCHPDPHGGQFADRPRGGACTTCHTEEAWKQVLFDHQRDADYALDGAHRNVRCVACHKPQGEPPVTRYRPLPHRCEDCHTPGPGGGNRL